LRHVESRPEFCARAKYFVGHALSFVFCSLHLNDKVFTRYMV
jgi:hypothetical protein